MTRDGLDQLRLPILPIDPRPEVMAALRHRVERALGAERHETRDIKPTFVPELFVLDGGRAVEFYKEAFGANELHRVTDEKGQIVAEMAIGDAKFLVCDETPRLGTRSPQALGGVTVRVGLVVGDPDEVVRQAISAGAREVAPVVDEPYGRIGEVEDPFGHRWDIWRPRQTAT